MHDRVYPIVVRVGQIERGKDYHLVNAYTICTSPKTIEYPWCTYREIQKKAKKIGVKVPRSEEIPYYDYINDTFGGTY
jgi:hypothetical protein